MPSDAGCSPPPCVPACHAVLSSVMLRARVAVRRLPRTVALVTRTHTIALHCAVAVWAVPTTLVVGWVAYPALTYVARVVPRRRRCLRTHYHPATATQQPRARLPTTTTCRPEFKYQIAPFWYPNPEAKPMA